MKSILLFLFFAGSFCVQAQHPADSLKIYDPFSNPDDIRRIIKNYFSILGEDNRALITQYSNKIESAKKMNDLMEELRYTIKTADIYFQAGIYNSALEKYSFAAEKYLGIGDTINAALTKIKLGRTYYFSDLVGFDSYIDSAYNTLQYSKDPEILAIAYYTKATVETDAVKSKSLLENALKLQYAVLKNKPGDKEVLMNLSKFLNAAGRLFEALEIVQRTGNSWAEVLYLNNIGARYLQTSEYETARTYFQKSVDICLDKKFKTLLRNSLINLSAAYRLMGDWKRSAYSLMLVYLVVESLYTEKYTIQASEFNVKYSTRQKELENELLKKEKQNLSGKLNFEKTQNYFLLITLAGSLFTAGYIFISRKKIKSKNKLLDEQNQKINQQKAELELLNLNLVRSEEQLKTAQSTVHLASWEMNLRTGEYSYSEEFPVIYGVEESSLKTNFVSSLAAKIHQDERNVFNSLFRSNFTDNAVHDFRIIENNSARWIKTKWLTLKDNEGNVARLFGTVQDITRDKEEEQLKIKIAAQQSFAQQLIQQQENERKRIAGELHDSIGQEILLIKNRVLLGLQTEIKNEFLFEQLNSISSSTSQVINQIRETAFNLRPAHLERLGLTNTIISSVKKVKDTTKINFTHRLDNIDDIFTRDKQMYIFRMIQEGMNNIIKHSGAVNGHIEIIKTEENVKINIIDDGKGFELKTDIEISGGFGLNNILNRVKILNGSLEIKDGRPGSRLEIVIPAEK